MDKTQQWQTIPTKLSLEQFMQFVFPYLRVGSRGPAPKLALYVIFNYILKLLHMGCQWKELSIERDKERDGRDSYESHPQLAVNNCYYQRFSR